MSRWRSRFTHNELGDRDDAAGRGDGRRVSMASNVLKLNVPILGFDRKCLPRCTRHRHALRYFFRARRCWQASERKFRNYGRRNPAQQHRSAKAAISRRPAVTMDQPDAQAEAFRAVARNGRTCSVEAYATADAL